MLKRIITSVVAVAVLLPVLWFSDSWIFPCAVALVTVVSLFEMFRCMGFHKNIALTLPLYLFAAAFPMLQRLLDGKRTVLCAVICGGAYLVYAFALTVWSHGKITYDRISALCLTSLYILLALNMIVYIRDFGESGRFIYLLIFVGAWITDIFAYFTGVFFGKHKLIEDVSPKKTIEGSVGGTLFCSLAYVLTGVIVDIFFDCNANLIFLAISGILMAAVAQIGDLIMSVIKRQYKIKDYGRLFPGHGGMLDRFDSILAVTLGVAIMCMFSQLTGIALM